jgi:hypothetical protein
MIAQSTTIKKDADAVPTRNYIFGNQTEEVIGVGLHGLMHDPRMKDEYGDLFGFGMIASANLADQNKPCVEIHEVQNQVRQKTINVDVIPEELGMFARPFSANRNAPVNSLTHSPCDIANLGQPILRTSNLFNPLMKPPFKAMVN